MDAVLDIRAIVALVRIESRRPRLVKAVSYQSKVNPTKGNATTLPSLNEKM